MSQIEILISALYSKPLIYAARIVAEIFNDLQLEQDWLKEVKTLIVLFQCLRLKQDWWLSMTNERHLKKNS